MEIKNFKEVNKGALVARFDIHFEKMGMSIRDCTLMRSGDNQWIGMPSRQYESDGQKKYFSYITFSEDKKHSFEAKCLELLKPFLPTVHDEPTEDLPF